MLTKSVNKALKYFLAMCMLYLGISMVLYPQVCLQSGKTAVSLCLNAVIPSLFPFFICSGLFSTLGLARLCSRFLSPLMRPLFNVPGAGALAFIIGIVSGYPMGASCAADLYCSGECTKTEAERLTAFCNNSGPLFIMGVVGCGILSNPQIGKYLYISHVLSALFTGLIFRYYGKNRTVGNPTLPPTGVNIKNTAEIIGSVVDNSIFSMLKVCAFVLIFSVFASVLPAFKFTPFVYALLEITGGVNAVAKINMDTTLKLSLLSFFIAFSGVSVMFQVSSVITPHGLSILPYFAGKLTQGVISFIITYTFLTHFPITQNVFAESYAMLSRGLSPAQLFFGSLLGMLVCGVVLLACSFIAMLLKRYSD